MFNNRSVTDLNVLKVTIIDVDSVHALQEAGLDVCGEHLSV